MPTIKLTDQLGLDVDVETDVLSSLAKYAGDLSKLSLSNLDLKSLADLTLANPSVTSLHTGLKFDRPVDIGAGGVTLDVKAGISGGMDIYVPPSSGGVLFDADLYGETVSVDPADRYVSLTLSASAGPDISSSFNQLSFGFQAGATVSLANYRKFSTQPAAPTIPAAIAATVAGFCIPGSPDDLRALPADSIVTLDGAGTITFSAQASLFASANPLATLKLPSPLPELDVTGGGSVGVSASCEVSWDYQLRVRKLDAARVSLGFYRKHGTETTVSIAASAGISASIGGQELFSSILTAVSKSAAADSDAMKSLGVPDSQRDAIGDAVAKAAQRKLQVSLLAAFTAADSHSAAFLYEFDMAVLDPAGNSALAAALRGDLHSLTGDALPAGVQMVRSIVTDVHRSRLTWKINLLGIYNHLSTTDLVRQGKVLYEPSTGDLVITDKATAQRISVDTVNVGADSDKLRKVLAESFLITAVYRGSKSLIAGPELSCSHSYFQLFSSTNADTMRKELTAVTALGLDAPDTLLGDMKDFGRTMVHAETSYDTANTPALFLNGSNPKPREEFESAGREAIRLLVRPDAIDSFRLRGVTDDQVWARMRRDGQPSFGPIFPDLPSNEVAVIATDYTVIVWWAKAMSQCAQSIASMQAQLAVNPDPESADFQTLRADLAKKLADVTSDTKAEFGQPWGLVAMDRVSGRRAAAKAQIAGAQFGLTRERQEVLAGAAAS